MGINQLMQYGYAELKYIIDWAKKVPGKWNKPIVQDIDHMDGTKYCTGIPRNYDSASIKHLLTCIYD